MRKSDKPILLPTPRHIELPGGSINVERDAAEFIRSVHSLAPSTAERKRDSNRDAPEREMNDGTASTPQPSTIDSTTAVRCHLLNELPTSSGRMSPADKEAYKLTIRPPESAHDAFQTPFFFVCCQ